jgi:hypothetical protein
MNISKQIESNASAALDLVNSMAPAVLLTTEEELHESAMRSAACALLMLSRGGMYSKQYGIGGQARRHLEIAVADPDIITFRYLYSTGTGTLYNAVIASANRATGLVVMDTRIVAEWDKVAPITDMLRLILPVAEGWLKPHG